MQKQRKTGGILAALVVLVGVPLAAVAGNVYAIQTAPSPSNGQPIQGGGSWIVNKPSGYYLGRAMVGSTFDVVQNTPANWHYGRAISTVNMCGWVMPGSMGAFQYSTADSCSEATKDMLVHRKNIGKDFNAAAHAAGDGTSVPAATNCPFYYNYFYGTDYTSNGGHWANFAGYTGAGYVLYRFTTRDGQAVVARDPNLGWGFAPSSCAGRPGTVYNDND